MSKKKFKNSWELMQEAESQDTNPYKDKYYMPSQHTEYWYKYDIGKEWRDKDGFWKRTKDGREQIDGWSVTAAIPAFCPECKKVINSYKSEQAYIFTGHCWYCELKVRSHEELKEIKSKSHHIDTTPNKEVLSKDQPS